MVMARRQSILRISRDGDAHTGEQIINVVKEITTPNASTRKLYLGENLVDLIIVKPY